VGGVVSGLLLLLLLLQIFLSFFLSFLKLSLMGGNVLKKKVSFGIKKWEKSEITIRIGIIGHRCAMSELLITGAHFSTESTFSRILYLVPRRVCTGF